MKQIINPAWKQHNDTYNEGGEGYNPHRKWISAPAQETVRALDAARAERLINVPGATRPLRESEVRAQLEDAKARLEIITDATARRLVSDTIAKLTAALGD